jgi:hypothetical protein
MARAAMRVTNSMPASTVCCKSRQLQSVPRQPYLRGLVCLPAHVLLLRGLCRVL